MEQVIEASGLYKNFGITRALEDVSFSVKPGEIFGLIGPDGSGKTTLMRIITTLMLPDKGNLSVLGLDCVRHFRELRKHIGYMPGRFSLYQDLSVEENLEFYATVFGTTIQENYNLIKDIYSQIEPFRKRLAGKLSGGMKQKLALSCALIHKPQLLVLDEPTTGVDAVSRSEFWQMLSGLKDNGITVIVSTPYMDEAMKCTRVALIQKGKLLSVDTPLEICAGFSKKLFTVRSGSRYKLLQTLRSWPETCSAYPFGDSVHVTTVADVQRDDLKIYLEGKGTEGFTVEESPAGIEDRFLELMESNTDE